MDRHFTFVEFAAFLLVVGAFSGVMRLGVVTDGFVAGEADAYITVLSFPLVASAMVFLVGGRSAFGVAAVIGVIFWAVWLYIALLAFTGPTYRRRGFDGTVAVDDSVVVFFLFALPFLISAIGRLFKTNDQWLLLGTILAGSLAILIFFRA